MWRHDSTNHGVITLSPYVSLVSVLSVDGSEPLIKDQLTSMCTSPVSLLKSDGIVPANWLLLSWRDVSAVSTLRPGGTGPLSAFWETSKELMRTQQTAQPARGLNAMRKSKATLVRVMVLRCRKQRQ